jgi:hypothetical protein
VGDNLYSHQGLTYGGLVISASTMLFEVIQINQVMLSFLYEQQILKLHLKIIPTIYNNIPSDEMEYISFLLHAKLYRRDAIAILDITNQVEKSRVRKRGIEKGLKNNLVIKEVDDFKIFWNELLIPNLKIAKFSGIENEYPHTHEDIIFFNKDVFSSLNNYQSKSNSQLSLAKTLIHEIFHIKQRETPILYDNLFNQWGFQSVSIQYLHQNLSNDVVSRIRINPDELPNYRFWVWKNKMMPLVVYSSTDVSGINDIMYIAVDWKNKKITVLFIFLIL